MLYNFRCAVILKLTCHKFVVFHHAHRVLVYQALRNPIIILYLLRFQEKKSL